MVDDGSPMTSSFSRELKHLLPSGRASDVGLAAHRLATGEEILIHADTTFHPASVIKICVMIEVFRQARLGAFSLDDSIPVFNRFSSIVDGSPYSLAVEDDSEKELYACIGQSLSRRELVRRMITVSSNLATNILMEQIQPKLATEYMERLGASGLVLRRGVEDNKAYRLGLNNSGTARGFMQVLLKLAKGEVISPEDSSEMIQILAQQQFNEMIPAELPREARVAHKTGWTADYFHDVGIIRLPSGERFILAILTKRYAETDKQAAHAFVAALARAVCEHWSRQGL
jgi:beta-lactamase class A